MRHGWMMLKMAILMVRDSGGEITVPRPGGSGICGHKKRERTSDTRPVVMKQTYSCLNVLDAGDAEKLSDSGCGVLKSNLKLFKTCTNKMDTVLGRGCRSVLHHKMTVKTTI